MNCLIWKPSLGGLGQHILLFSWIVTYWSLLHNVVRHRYHLTFQKLAFWEIWSKWQPLMCLPLSHCSLWWSYFCFIGFPVGLPEKLTCWPYGGPICEFEWCAQRSSCKPCAYQGGIKNPIVFHHCNGCHGDLQVVEVRNVHSDLSIQALELDLCMVPSISSFLKNVQSSLKGTTQLGHYSYWQKLQESWWLHKCRPWIDLMVWNHSNTPYLFPRSTQS